MRRSSCPRHLVYVGGRLPPLWFIVICFCITKNKALGAVTQHLNSMKGSIQFTVEEEATGRLPFLDGTPWRSPFVQGLQKANPYRPVSILILFTGPATNAVVASLVRRTRNVCSKPEDQAADMRQVRQELGDCGYLGHFVDSTLRRSSCQSDSVRPPCRTRAAIPYVPGVSESLVRGLRTHDVHTAHVQRAS